MSKPEIRFCTTSDGVRIAYTTFGDGPLLVRVPGWVSHLDLMLTDPGAWAMNEEYARTFHVVTYDKRGTGLSDRGLTDYSVASRLKDLEAVVEDLKLRRFALAGYSEGGPVAIAFAAAHPKRVSHLALRSTYARFPRGGARAGQLREAIIALVRAEWGLGSHALSDIMVPEASPEMREGFLRMQKVGATREDAARMLEAIYEADVTPLLPKIRMPTLVMHGTHDSAIPFAAGRELAGGIRGARFVPLDAGHVPPWDQYLPLIAEFITSKAPAGVPESAAAAPLARGGLVTIVFTDVERNTEILQQLGDAAWRELLREHERITRDLLKQYAGDEIKTIGDAFMASFGSATKALECAIALQRAFAARSETAAHPLRVRIGVNAGEPIAEDGDLFGTSVTTASRISAMAAGGEILASNVVRELVAGKGFLFADRGDTALRGFEDPVRIYELRWQEPA